MRKLTRFGEVTGGKCLKYKDVDVETGNRVFGMKLRTSIPSYIHFRAEAIRVRYPRQQMT